MNQQLKSCIHGSETALRVAWALIDARPLIREALIRIIEETGAPAVIGAASAQDFLNDIAHMDVRVGLIMICAADGTINQEQFCREYDLLRKRMVDVPLVVLSDRMDLDDISHAFRAGARGYIPTSGSSTEVMRALKRVAAGGVHVPVEALPQLLETFHNGAQQDNREKAHEKRRFTPRQLEVVKLLCKGKPNKIIGYELDMQECTVKVHVREIMKKLKVSNRTEAALRAGQLLADLGEEDVPDVSKRQAIGQAS